MTVAANLMSDCIDGWSVITLPAALASNRLINAGLTRMPNPLAQIRTIGIREDGAPRRGRCTAVTDTRAVVRHWTSSISGVAADTNGV